MSHGTALDLAREALLTALLLGAPILLCAVVVGLIVSLLQAVTQLQDQTLSFVPKIAAMGAVLLYAFPWMLDRGTGYATELFQSIAANIGR